MLEHVCVMFFEKSAVSVLPFTQAAVESSVAHAFCVQRRQSCRRPDMAARIPPLHATGVRHNG